MLSAAECILTRSFSRSDLAMLYDRGARCLFSSMAFSLTDRFNRTVALQEYILLLAQHPRGGLRDKPPKNADYYHTANNLSGISSAQHRLVQTEAQKKSVREDWVPREGKAEEERKREVFVNAMGWKEVEENFLAVGGEQNRVVSGILRDFHAKETDRDLLRITLYGDRIRPTQLSTS